MILSINVTLNDINRSTDNYLADENQHKWGSPDCFLISQSITLNDMSSTEQYIEINVNDGVGEVEVDRQIYPVESSVHLRIDFNSNYDIHLKNKIKSVEFSAFLVEFKTNNRAGSISEIEIIQHESLSNNLSWVLVLVMLISLKLIFSKLIVFAINKIQQN